MRFVDSDEQIERRAGRTVREIFEADGEAAFRQLEAEALAEARRATEPRRSSPPRAASCSTRRTASCCGGRARSCGCEPSPRCWPARVRAGDHRPLLGDDPLGALRRLDAERRAALRGGGRRGRRRRRPRRPTRSSTRIAGAGARDHRPGVAGRPLLRRARRAGRPPPAARGDAGRRAAGGRRHPAAASASRSTPASSSARSSWATARQAKDLETVEELCRQFSRWGLTRGDVVVAVGGGVVTDTAGFAAAVYHRGVPVVHVATSLLAQVDAAIGGKTGVNLPEGKNLVGAFWQPAAVLCDTEVLETLPPREYRSGLGRDGEVPLPRRRATSRPAPSTKRSPRACAARPRRRRATSASRRVARHPQLRPHAGPRARDGRRLRPAPRRGGGHRPGVRGPPGAPRWVASTTARVAEHRAVVGGYDLPAKLPPGASDSSTSWST